MKEYNTCQRKILIDFLNVHSDEYISATNIVAFCEGRGISKSAVYRNLSALEQCGKIRRTTKPGERVAYFQYADGAHCKGKIHISCIKCGKMGHISSDMAEYMAKELEQEEQFSLDKNETVIYGLCNQCRE